MQLVVPADALHPKRIHEAFTSQVDAFMSSCGTPALFSMEEGTVSRVRSGETLLYRGWMLRAEEYANMTSLLTSAGGTPLTSLTQYLNTHHLPNWYPLLQEFTPETKVFTNEELTQIDIVAELQKLGWRKFFLKDYVKSLKTSRGSTIEHAGQASALIDLMTFYRNGLEGGLCVRKFETLRDEVRYFIMNETVYAPAAFFPNVYEAEIFKAVIQRIDSPFISVDIAYNDFNHPRIVEIGDGQVSGLVGWTPEQFQTILQS